MPTLASTAAWPATIGSGRHSRGGEVELLGSKDSPDLESRRGRAPAARGWIIGFLPPVVAPVVMLLALLAAATRLSPGRGAFLLVLTASLLPIAFPVPPRSLRLGGRRGVAVSLGQLTGPLLALGAALILGGTLLRDPDHPVGTTVLFLLLAGLVAT